MTILSARWTDWRSLAGGLALAAAATVAVALIELPGRGTAPVADGAPTVAATVDDAAPSRDASPTEVPPARAARPTASDRAGSPPAVILYMLMEAARLAPLLGR